MTVSYDPSRDWDRHCADEERAAAAAHHTAQTLTTAIAHAWADAAIAFPVMLPEQSLDPIIDMLAWQIWTASCAGEWAVDDDFDTFGAMIHTDFRAAFTARADEVAAAIRAENEREAAGEAAAEAMAEAMAADGVLREADVYAAMSERDFDDLLGLDHSDDD